VEIDSTLGAAANCGGVEIVNLLIRNSKCNRKEDRQMARPRTDSRPITICLPPDIWASIEAEKAKRPNDSFAEIIRDRLKIKTPNK